MRSCLSVAALFLLFSCKTTKIKGEKFEISNASVEIGAIGHSNKLLLENDFSSKTYPKLKNNIRLDVQIVPFSKDHYKKYSAKAKFNQQQKTINYVDSVAVKPEFALIRIMDSQSYISELNADYNTGSLDFIKASGKGVLVTAIAIVQDSAELEKIRMADAFYLINKHDHKYELALFSQGKQSSTIAIKSENIFAYETSNFCWMLNKKGKWEVADIIRRSEKCNGEMTSVATEKKASKNLFKM